jgi:hypothetical protein
MATDTATASSRTPRIELAEIAHRRPRHTGSLSRPLRGRVSAWHLLAVVAGLATLLLTVGPVSETDVFWHIAAGNIFLHHGSFPGHDPWAYTFPGRHWQSTEWLAEISLALVYRLGGFVAISALRLALTALLVGWLLRVLVRGRAPWVAALVFAVVAPSLTYFIQERPDLASLVLLVWLARVCAQAIRLDRAPSIPVTAVVTWFWACIHGYWVLVPAGLLLAAVGVWLDGRPEGRPIARRTAIAAGAAVVASALTPLGPHLWLDVLRLGGSAKGIEEWGPTVLTQPLAFGLVGLLIVFAICWTRGRHAGRVPWSEVLWVVCWTGFAWHAIRDIAPAMLMLALPAADRLQVSFGHLRPRVQVPRWAVAVLALVGLVTVCVDQARQPSLTAHEPVAIARLLSHQPGQLRVLDDYNVSGFLILEAGRHVRVAVDGRSDRYGSTYITRYLDMEAGAPGWDRMVTSLRPDVAVLDRHGALAYDLVRYSHWQVVLTDTIYELLVPPGHMLLDVHTRPVSGAETT